MKNHNQNGTINALLLPLVLAVLMLIGALAFGYWTYGSRQDYKNNVDQKINAAVAIAQQQESAIKDKQFALQSEQPLTTYTAPQQYGSLSIMYPKNWSSYVDDTGSGQSALDGYFQPGTVPAVGDVNNNYALRVQVLQQSYSDTLQTFAGMQNITVTPYTLPKMPKVIGVRIQGAIVSDKTGDMIVLPLRGTTLEIYTEAQQYEADFNNNILPNVTFQP